MKYYKHILIVALLSADMLCGGCKKKNGNFTLQIKGMYGNQSLALDSTYTDPAGRYFMVKDLMFYLSNINLIKTDNSQLNVSEVSFINFADPTSVTITVNDVNGDFKGISWGCGLDSAQNTTDPNTATGPLGGNAANLMYWSMLRYRFEVLDAYWDTTKPLEYALAYHVGTNPLYRTTSLSKTFSVCCGSNYTLTVYLDVQKIFYGDSGTLNISIPSQELWQANPQDSPSTGTIFVGNFSQAFTD